MAMPPLPDLPVRDVLPDVVTALEASGSAVLPAPPGAGKTTLVPLALLDAPWRKGNRIILVEPRRLAARAAARRMASLLGEAAGETVGYRMRLDTRISDRTVIEVVTEGVFTRMALDNPDLNGIAAVIFDEFHERALDADFGLALALDIRDGLREDLRIMVMSATLDVSRFAGLLGGAPVIESEGRAFPVDIRYRDRKPGGRIEDTVADAITDAHRTETGSILAFLPGQGEIRRTATLLDDRFGTETSVVPLYGNLTGAEQDAAIRPPEPGRRKIVLATSIAETSITIDGVRIVIDSGLARVPVFEPAMAMTRLETVRASRASADQRAGRAGRTEPGIAIRLWRAEQNAALPGYQTPEILSADLSALVLDCAAWGVTDPTTLAFADPPPAPALAEARNLLVSLGALDAAGHITPAGKRMRGLGLPVRLAAMVIDAADRGDDTRTAAELAVLISEQGLGGPSIDLDDRLRRFRSDRGDRAKAARGLAERIAKSAGGKFSIAGKLSVMAGPLLLSAFLDRVAIARGGRGRFVMANGRGAQLDESDRLAGMRHLVIADVTGRAAAPRILAAAEIDREAIVDRMGDRIETIDETEFDAETRSVRARRVTRLGALVLEQASLPKPGGVAAAEALARGVAQAGLSALPWTKQASQLRQRLRFLHESVGAPWPDVSDDALLSALDIWFTPFQSGVTSFGGIAPATLEQGLAALIPYEIARDLDRLAPSHFEVPTGSRIAIRYDGPEPVLPVRVQELFGLATHPAIAGGRQPLVLELLSPAHRPIQTTRDLPGFWAGSWRDVRADMRGRYPKHPWPEDPAAAEPTRRAKPRKG